MNPRKRDRTRNWKLAGTEVATLWVCMPFFSPAFLYMSLLYSLFLCRLAFSDLLPYSHQTVSALAHLSALKRMSRVTVPQIQIPGRENLTDCLQAKG